MGVQSCPVSSLTAQYDLLSAAQIQTLANGRLQKQLQERAQQRQQEQLDQNWHEQQPTASSNSGSSSGGVSRIEVELNVAGVGALNAEELRKNKRLGLDVARELIPHINRLIGRGVRLGG